MLGVYVRDAVSMEEGTWRWWCFVACYVDAEVVERTGRSMARASRAQFLVSTRHHFHLAGDDLLLKQVLP